MEISLSCGATSHLGRQCRRSPSSPWFLCVARLRHTPSPHLSHLSLPGQPAAWGPFLGCCPFRNVTPMGSHGVWPLGGHPFPLEKVSLAGQLHCCCHREVSTLSHLSGPTVWRCHSLCNRSTVDGLRVVSSLGLLGIKLLPTSFTGCVSMYVFVSLG